MNEDIFNERLTYFKEKERPEVILLLTDNAELMRIVVAWPNVEIHRPERYADLHKNSIENEVWRWLWEHTHFSNDDLAAASSIRGDLISCRMRPLIRNRILYPDGTVNSYVEKYLRDRVLDLFGASRRKSTKRSAS